MDGSLAFYNCNRRLGTRCQELMWRLFCSCSTGAKTSCHLKKTWKRKKKKKTERALAPFENRARMGSASSAEYLRGVVLEVLRTRAVHQCSALLTMRVLAVLPLRLKYVGVHYYGYYPYLQDLGFYISSICST